MQPRKGQGGCQATTDWTPTKDEVFVDDVELGAQGGKHKVLTRDFLYLMQTTAALVISWSNSR